MFINSQVTEIYAAIEKWIGRVCEELGLPSGEGLRLTKKDPIFLGMDGPDSDDDDEGYASISGLRQVFEIIKFNGKRHKTLVSFCFCSEYAGGKVSLVIPDLLSENAMLKIDDISKLSLDKLLDKIRYLAVSNLQIELRFLVSNYMFQMADLEESLNLLCCFPKKELT